MVFFDPAQPDRSVAGKIDLQPFRWGMLAAWLIAAIVASVIALRRFFADLPQRDQTTGALRVNPLLAEGEPSDGLSLMLMVALFAVGFAFFCAWPGLRVEDPIFGRYVPFHGFVLAVVVGVMCSMAGVAMRLHRPPRSLLLGSSPGWLRWDSWPTRSASPGRSSAVVGSQKGDLMYGDERVVDSGTGRAWKRSRFWASRRRWRGRSGNGSADSSAVRENMI